jgi:hypothetical protein
VLSLFSSRRNWDSPNPSPAGECAPSPVLGGGAHSLAREVLGESQFRRGDIHCGTLYSLHIRTLCCRNNDQAHACISSKNSLQESGQNLYIFTLFTQVCNFVHHTYSKLYQCTKTSFQSSHQCMFALIGSITYAAFTVDTVRPTRMCSKHPPT